MFRFGYSDAQITSWPAGVGIRSTRSIQLGSHWLCCIDGEPAAFQMTISGLTLLPSLNTPYAKLSAGVLTFFSLEGITPVNGDTLLNMLRAWRDGEGESAASFDISGEF